MSAQSFWPTYTGHNHLNTASANLTLPTIGSTSAANNQYAGDDVFNVFINFEEYYDTKQITDAKQSSPSATADSTTSASPSPTSNYLCTRSVYS